MVREKIRASVIIDRLQKHIAGKIDMSASQVAAASALLNKVVPNLSASTIKTEGGLKLKVELVGARRTHDPV